MEFDGLLNVSLVEGDGSACADAGGEIGDLGEEIGLSLFDDDRAVYHGIRRGLRHGLKLGTVAGVACDCARHVRRIGFIHAS